MSIGGVIYLIAMCMYLGERCKYCKKEFKELDDLNNAVYVGRHRYGSLACKSCYDNRN